jgi:steroid 5-alpha reductase family enzyme
MNELFWIVLVSAYLLLFLLMSLVTLVANRIKNAGLVDVIWAFSFVLLALFYFALGDGWVLRKALISIMMALASFRLGYYLLKRFLKEHPVEDGRYHVLRLEWEPRGPQFVNLMFFVVYQFQGVLILLLSIPFLWICMNPTPTLSWLEWLGIVLWMIGVVGEMMADEQLRQFKANPENHGKTCQVGLWNYSRHPNYFFEWLLWVAYFVFGLATPWGWTMVYAPVLMLVFLTKVTGIPATEAHSLKTRGEAYRLYQETTSPFIPWFKGKGNV